MKIIGKRDEFLDWLEKLSVGGAFETAIVKITPNGIISSNTETAIYRFLDYKKLKTIVAENEDSIIKFQVSKLYQTIDKLFNDDDKITVEVISENGEGILRIYSNTIERIQPLFYVQPDEREGVDRIKFKVENNIPFLKQGTFEMKNRVYITADFVRKMVGIAGLQDILSKWRLSIKNNKFVVEIGDVLNTKDAVRLTPENIIVKADHDVSVDFGLQMKNIAKVFKTDVTLFIESNMPAIFHESTMDYDLWIMLAHIVPEEALAETEAMMQAEEEAREEEIAQQELEYEMSEGAPEE